MTVEKRLDEPKDQLEFPVGMRVLAVDDDPICLLLLETLLRRCQYHVTTTNQARTALELLRENKDKFDLVISDVHMPDMDGFKLLELVGLEMDLPVIMLSGNDDPRLVMKGITHGACDYLLKPIRLEELKIIWQHVIRKKKKPSTSQKASNKLQNGSSEGGHGSTGTLNKKRKDQIEDDYEENDENAQDNEDSSTQKKPRVVWSGELHRKFVVAVQQLGIDRAVPKRILELMNVENLSRENVASHLQKYRLFLRKYSHVASQQANMVTAYGNSIDSNYLRMLSINGLGSYNTLSGSHVQNGTFSSFPQKGMFGRLNTPAGLGVRGLSSSGMGQVQLSHTQNPTFPSSDMDKFQIPSLFQGNQNENILRGMPLSIDFDQIKGFTSATTPTGFPVSSGLTDIKSTTGGLENTTVRASNDPLMTFLGSDLTSQTHVRGSDDWPNAVQSSGQHFINNSSKQDLSSNGFRGNVPSQAHQFIGNQAEPHVTDSMTQRKEYTPKQGWGNPPVQSLLNRSNACGSIDSINFGNTYSLDQTLDPKVTSFHNNVGFNVTGQPNFDYSVHMLHNGIGNSALDITVRSNQGQPQGGQSYHTFGSLEDLVSAVMKKEQRNATKMENDFETDDFTTLGTC